LNLLSNGLRGNGDRRLRFGLLGSTSFFVQPVCLDSPLRCARPMTALRVMPRASAMSRADSPLVHMVSSISSCARVHPGLASGFFLCDLVFMPGSSRASVSATCSTI